MILSRLTLFVFLSVGSIYCRCQTNAKKPFVIGETMELQSDILHESRVLHIYLPQNYSPDSSKTYPVIYLLDGSADEDFIHVAGLVQFLSFPWIQTVEESLVVGISNVDRQRDFTFPTTIEQDRIDFPTTGHSDLFMDFLEKELIPFVERNYKTSDRRSLIGKSLGGLLATQLLVERTALFDRYFIISPSLWWDNQSLLNRVVDLDLGHRQIYIAVGNEGPLMVKPARALYKKLKRMNPASEETVFYHYLKDKNHGDALHEALYDGFVKMNGTNFEAIHVKRKSSTN